MSNRFYFTLMGICLIGIFFFLLKMLCSGARSLANRARSVSNITPA